MRTLLSRGALLITIMPVLLIFQNLAYNTETASLRNTELAGSPLSMCRTGGQYQLDIMINYSEPIAPRLEGLGNTHFEITTSVPECQDFFDQGMRLVYGFNHAEAHRSFTEASRLDPDCAMAKWGIALALGPNINDPFPDLARQKLAYQAIQESKSLLDDENELERSLIEALSARCTNVESEQQSLNLSYAAAMEPVYGAHMDHPEVGILYAASKMNTMPWNYYDEDKNPRPGTQGTIAALEKVIAESNHPGAHHYFIHIIEAADPDRAIATADILGDMMPGAGHMVHMPSHIYIGVGMYEQAAERNRKAILADEEYIAQCQAQGIYPLAYYPHNIHFLWAAASLQGNSEEAIDAAREVALKVPANQALAIPFIQDYLSVPLQAYVRFGKWNDILSTPQPDESLLHVNLMWHYARGMAFVRRGNYELADSELTAVKELANKPEMQELYAAYNNPTSHVGEIAYHALAGELAAARTNYSEAVELLTKAVELEDELVYQEPSAWHYPMRHSLGAVLLDAGELSEAEEVYRDDLQIWRQNGWSLYGLIQSLQRQGKHEEVAKTKKQFDQAWQYADVTLTSSRM